MAPTKQIANVGGLIINVYSTANATPASRPVSILVLMHGRTGSSDNAEPWVHAILQRVEERRAADGGSGAEDLLIVTFDHRNHGSRLVDAVANSAWAESPRNDRHAIDMYAIQVGTARDVSYLIDFLPAYLFPEDERTISRWIVAGVSLGGHSSWLTLEHEPRVKIGIPIIGCPNYLDLIKQRAKSSSVPFAPPYIPNSLLAKIKELDPSPSSGSTDARKPFLGKKVLVLSGGDDPVVPWSASKSFVDSLDVGPSGVKKVIVAPGVGHEVTQDMLREAADFIWEEALTQ